MGIEIPLLKVDSVCDLSLVVGTSCWSDYKFVFVIILSANSADYPAVKGAERLCNTQNVYILLL